MLITTRLDLTAEQAEPSRPADPPEKYVPDVVYSATRSLMRVSTSEEVIGILTELVRRLGGDIVPASAEDPDALRIDISMGQGDPVYPVAASGSASHWLIRTYLPNVIEDAQTAYDLTRRAEQLAKDAGIDSASALPNHRTLSRVVTRLQAGDAIVAVDLDWARGMREGESSEDQEMLRAFAHDVRQATRANEFCGRSSGGEFMVLLNNPGDHGAEKLLERLRDRWSKRPWKIGITFSGGIAAVDERGWRPAIQAADRALRRSQKKGDSWESALADDYEP